MNAFIFCKVIDNFGDAGFALRLSREFCLKFSLKVILRINRPDLIVKMLGDENLPNFQLLPWDSQTFALQNGDIVIELFSCHLPDFALKEIEKTTANFAWFAMDYLGLEKWILDCHLKPSPQKNKTKYFYFPSFLKKGGGIINEKSELPSPFDLKKPWKINVFLYDESPIQFLKNQNLNFLDKNAFLPQKKFDAELDSATLNLIRGEDSFVRAILAGQPFVWQAYRQKDDAHFQKVLSFLEIFSLFLDSKIRQHVCDFFYFLNAMRTDFSAESLLSPETFTIWQQNSRAFAQTLLAEKSLPKTLIDFVKSKKYGVDRGKF